MKLLIIDDQRLYAEGIKGLLKTYDQSFEIDYAQNLMCANDRISCTENLDLIILSVNDVFSENSYNVIDKIDILNHRIPIIICSAKNSHDDIAKASENKASGYISKSYSPDMILESILTVLRGDLFQSIEKQELSNSQEIQVLTRNDVTARQKEVLSLVSKGLLNKQIAHELDISPNTVKIHLNNIFRKLNVTNRTAAVKNGYEYGLI